MKTTLYKLAFIIATSCMFYSCENNSEKIAPEEHHDDEEGKDSYPWGR